ncbi:MAG: hypothetical protein PHW11_00150 [Anaerolineaceae bacterium]|jgi:hypothetical protein|nr:hypothetical protein [Anaerolineaceae bacterium]MDD4042235.1 hypothetical protein [Anaerolineaceae bacterium]MDD4578694.1 hypothetical protein [Anaerolineaceae bacterium]
MLSYLIGFAGFVLTAMLQMSVFSQWKILSGSADIVLLFVIAWCLHDRSKRLWLLVLIMAGAVGAISAVPTWIPMVVYFIVYQVSRLFQARLMQSPLLSMLVLAFGASLLQTILNLVYLFVTRVDLNFTDALVEVALPSILLNMLLAIPMHAIVREVAHYAFPKGVEA